MKRKPSLPETVPPVSKDFRQFLEQNNVDHTCTEIAPRKAIREPKRGAKNVVTIDADQWAESGGTGGMFGPAWREGRLRIMPSEYE